MEQAPYYIDIANNSLNKHGEELCGDKVEIVKGKDRTIVVLADGLGSGVKANILATLTAKMMITMLEKGIDLDEVIDTLTNTLPVCQVRKIGYSTFSILDIDSNLTCRFIEFDNPPIFFVRNHEILNLTKRELLSNGKRVKVSQCQLQIGDEITMCSDGVVHAGVGKYLNHGWEWEHVAEYLAFQNVMSAEKINRRLIETCNKLYGEVPGDDTTAVTVKIRTPEWIQIFTGPPEDKKDDEYFVADFMKRSGKKVVCGGTAAQILSRVTNKEIITTLDYIDPEIPPTAKMEGVDLVTEGVLTLKMLLNALREMQDCCDEPIFNKDDAVNKLLKLLIEESTHISFMVGRAINPAHQNPDFPADLSIKINVVNDIIETLRVMGKHVDIEYMMR